MASLGTLAVNIVARTDKFVRGVSKSMSQVDRFRKSMGRVTPSVKAFGGALVGAMGVGSVAAIKGVADQLNRLAKTSDKLGVATQQLAALRFAAAQTGVSANTFDMAFQRMVRRVAEAAQGSGEAVKALDELGLSAKRLMTLSPDAQFRAIADAMQGVANQGDRVRLAMKLFDSEGVELVRTLDLGAKGLRRMESQLFGLGGAFNRDELANVENMLDTVNRIVTLYGTVGQGLVVRISPEAEKWLKRYEQAMHGAAMLARGETPTTGFLKRVLGGIVTSTVKGVVDQAAGRRAELGVGETNVAAKSKSGLSSNHRRVVAQVQAFFDAFKPASLPSPIAAAFRGLGGLVASGSNLGASAGATFGRASLSFAESGSAESFRQRAAIRRQNAGEKGLRDVAKNTKAATGLLEQIRDGLNAGVALLPANFRAGVAGG